MVLTEVVEVGKSLVEFGLELGEDFVFCPREALEILNPLEVTDGDAAGIAEDVGDEEDVAALLDDGIGLGGGGTVGGFSEDAAFEFGGIVLGDNALEGRGDKGVALLKEECIGVDGLCSGESFDASVGGNVFVEGVVVVNVVVVVPVMVVVAVLVLVAVVAVIDAVVQVVAVALVRAVAVVLVLLVVVVLTPER